MDMKEHEESSHHPNMLFVIRSLIPLRIAHHPGAVLVVVITDDSYDMSDRQDDWSPMGQSSDADNNQALVVRSQGHAAAGLRQPSTSSSHYQQGTGNDATKQTNQRMLDQIGKILQTLQQMDQQHIEETQPMAHESNLHRPECEESQDTQDIREAHQTDEIVHKIQEMEQRAQSTREQHNPLQPTHKMEKVSQHQNRSSIEQSPSKTPHAFGQFVHAQCHAQAVLDIPSRASPVPRLFIILPAPTAAVDGQEESCQLRFKVHFLCECGSHTMSKECNEPHKVHLANHPGYDLTNQNEFVNKYGPYLLAMMYTVKYGAKARGLVVPPSLGLNNAIGEGENISQLVDETITHLKEAIGSREATVHKGLDASELNALKSYLKTKDGESCSGGLSQLKTQKAQHPWICRDHLREYYESTLQELRCNINANGGIWRGTEIKVQVTSEAAVKVFYDGLSELFRIQNVENWRSITELDLNLDNHPSMSGSTMDILSNPDDLETLSLDFGRLTMSAKNISRGELKDVAISVGDISALTLNDMEFIQQCCPIALAITGTPQEKDDNRLFRILQRYPSITSLQIECDMKRLMAVIDLVKSTREKMLQGEGRSRLSIFELIHPEVQVKVSFGNGYPDLDVETCVKLGNCQPQFLDPAVYTFIRRYGWSVTTLVVPDSFSNRLAKILDESVREKGSKMAHLNIAPTSLTTPGLDAMSRVINRSQGLTYLRLSLEDLGENNQREKALLLLGRHKDRLTSLRLVGWYVGSWLTPLSRTFPDRDGFPVLEEFFLECGKGLTGDTGQWITSMVSARPQPLTPVKVFGMKATELWYKGFESLINAIDLSTLEELHIKNDDFSPEQLKLLVDRVADYGAPSMPLRLLDINEEKLDNSANTHELFVSLREKVPEIKITGIKA